MRITRGYTLVEIMIASAMALLVLGALIGVFNFGREVEREVRSSYLIRADADIVFRRLQEELRLTHLASIRPAPDDNGFAMASPLEGGDLSSFELTGFGVPKWKNWVHFVVTPRDGNENVGSLVRRETPYPANTTVPLPPPGLPPQGDGTGTPLLSDVVLAGRGPVRSKETSWELGEVSGGGGLQIRFVRRVGGQDRLSKINPSQRSDGSEPGWTSGSTSLVDCRLQVAESSDESGRLNLYTLQFRVKPRN